MVSGSNGGEDWANFEQQCLVIAQLCSLVMLAYSSSLSQSHFVTHVSELFDCLPEVVVFWLLSIPATCLCISGTGLLRQLYELLHWDRSCRSNCVPHPVTVYWHQANQPQRYRVADRTVYLTQSQYADTRPTSPNAIEVADRTVYLTQSQYTDTRPTSPNAIEVADRTVYLTQSQYTDTRSTSPSADPIAQGAWQGSQWSANFLSHHYDLTWKNPHATSGNGTWIFCSWGGRHNY